MHRIGGLSDEIGWVSQRSWPVLSVDDCTEILRALDYTAMFFAMMVPVGRAAPCRRLNCAQIAAVLGWPLEIPSWDPTGGERSGAGELCQRDGEVRGRGRVRRDIWSANANRT